MGTVWNTQLVAAKNLMSTAGEQSPSNESGSQEPNEISRTLSAQTN